MRSIAEWTRLAAAVPGIERTGLLGPAAADLEAFAAEYAAGATASAASIAPRPPASSPICWTRRTSPCTCRAKARSNRAIGRRWSRLRSRAAPADAGNRVEPSSPTMAASSASGTADGILRADEVVLAPALPRLTSPRPPARPAARSRRLACSSIRARTQRLLNGLVLAERCICARPPRAVSSPAPTLAAPIPADLVDTARRCSPSTGDAGAAMPELDFHTLGYRPTPADGFPIIGRADGVDGLYVAVMHSGITLAPTLGCSRRRNSRPAAAIRCCAYGLRASLNSRAGA